MNLHNANAIDAINICNEERRKIDGIITKTGSLNPVVEYLSRYFLIKACGTIEICFKSIIADYNLDYSPQIDRFISVTVKRSSKNPSYNNICSVLKEFDENWEKSFKNKVMTNPSHKKLLESLGSLNNLRNQFAHGASCAPSFKDTASFYEDAIKVIEVLDEVVKK